LRRRLLIGALLGVLAVTGTAAGADVPAGPTAASPWKLVFRDNFSGSALDLTRWGPYYGQPKSGGMWLPSHIKVADGMVTLQGYKDPAYGGKWVSAGIGNRRGLIQTYGKYRVRMRLDNAYGLSYAALLWPKSNVNPPEVDFAEGFGRSMARTKATVHSGTQAAHVRLGKNTTVDMTKWHTVGVEWTPNKLMFTIDNVGWWTVTGNQVPSTPMVLDLQSQIHDCSNPVWACPNATSPARMNMYIDWVETYSWHPAS
jgi:beta-glucanase (GH16 family)